MAKINAEKVVANAPRRTVIKPIRASHMRRVPPAVHMKIPAEAGISKERDDHLLSPRGLPSAVQA